jgi:hypothetical protein
MILTPGACGCCSNAQPSVRHAERAEQVDLGGVHDVGALDISMHAYQQQIAYLVTCACMLLLLLCCTLVARGVRCGRGDADGGDGDSGVDDSRRMHRLQWFSPGI